MHKKKLLIVIMLIIINVSAATGCVSQISESNEIDRQKTIKKTQIDSSVDTKSSKELVLKNDKKTLNLYEYVVDGKIIDVFGAPKNTSEKTYTEQEDETMAGNTIKKYIYDRLTIETIHSKNEKPYVYSIRTTNPLYTTGRGVKVGDTADSLKASYRDKKFYSAENLNNNSDLQFEKDCLIECTNTIGGEQVDTIKVSLDTHRQIFLYVIKDGKVSEIIIESLLY